jgi:drug/metabolite transporter (DMT)-like permease
VTAPHPQTERQIFALLLRLGAVLLFAGMFALAKLVQDSGVSLAETLFWRQAFAIPPILAWVYAGPGFESLKTKRFPGHVRRAMLGMSGMIFTIGALGLLPLAEATTIGFTMPLFGTILAALLLKEHVGAHRWSAVLIGFVGVLIVVQPGNAPIPPLGAGVALVGAFMVALVSIQIKDLSKTEPPVTIAFWFSLLGTIPPLLFMPFVAMPHEGRVWLMLAAMGMLGGGAQMLMSSALRHGAVSAVLVMDYSSLIWTALLGWLIWDHLPPATTWFGAPIIVASGLYIAWREHKLAIERARGLAA